MSTPLDEYAKLRKLNRRMLLQELLALGSVSGCLNLVDFLDMTWDLEEMQSTDSRFKTASGDIWQHMVNNDDWDLDYLFGNYLELLDGPEDQLLRFLENVVHPTVRDAAEQQRYVETINKHLRKEGFELRVREEYAGHKIYNAARLGVGVPGKAKNIVFAANGPKPRIVLADAVSNDIQIVANQEYCLVYDRPISASGLLWSDLVSWWASLREAEVSLEMERSLFKRLRESLSSDSPPERCLFDAYFRTLRDEFGDSLPALIPQVYLHYDPYTTGELRRKLQERHVVRQRMDFLLLLPHQRRIVIEVDGAQHYAADDGQSSPKKYAEMVAADRDLRLAGYEVYRFGGIELQPERGPATVEAFFRSLFRVHGIRAGAQT